MQLHPTSRPRRVRRLIAVSAAAVAVMIAPTACDYGGAAQLDLPTHAGHTDGMNMDPQEHDVVPVGQTVTTTPDPAEADAETASTAGARRRRGVASERRRGDDGAGAAATGRRRRRRSRPRPAGRRALGPGRARSSRRAPPPAAPTPRLRRHRGCRRLPAGGRHGAQRSHPSARLRGQQTAGPHRLPVGEGRMREHLHGRGRPGGAAAVAADHQRSASASGSASRSSSRSAPATWCATGSSARPRAATTWRARSSTMQACSAGTSTPPAGSCRRPRSAPDSAPAPAFFLATQDNGGGAAPDTVTIERARPSRRSRRHHAVHVVGR